MSKTFSMTIDDHKVKVPAKTTILQAARKIGPQVTPPAMCYYTNLKGSGGYCRTCLVKVSKVSDENPRAIPRLVPSCLIEAEAGMVVKNVTDPEVLEAREGVVRFLLLNHPLDCPVCDEAGECHLQDLSYEHGKEKGKNIFPRRIFPMRNIGNHIKLHMNRCILCYRCVQVADQLTDQRVHGVTNRGEDSEISTYIERAIDNDFSGNMIDVCPVGALTDRTFRFKSRVWYTKPVYASRDCSRCSGKVTLWYQGEKILRVTGRKDFWGEVKDFICNDCRFERKKTSDWQIEGLADIDRHSVISTNKYPGEKKLPITDIRFKDDIHLPSQTKT